MALSDAINAWVEGYLAVKLNPTATTEEYVGALPSILNWGPVESVPTITRKGGAALVADTDFTWSTEGQLWPLLDLGEDIWEIAYTAGYAAVPAGLTAAIAQIQTAIVADSGIISESLGDYSYTLIAQASMRHLFLLDTYKRLFA